MPILSTASIENLAFLMDFLDNFKIKTKYGALAVTATSVIIIAGIFTALLYKRKAVTRKCVLTRSMSFGVLHGGKLALERLVHYHHACADAASLNSAEADLIAQLKEENPDFKNLQVTIAKLEMSGIEAKAVEILRTNLDLAQKKGKSHEAYEIEMLLVEMLIYKGDFEEARKCTCLKDQQITDARLPLYNAIIHVMLNDSTSAHRCWDDFNDIRIHFQWPPSLQDSDIYEVIKDFEKFKNVVNSLKNDIMEIKKNAKN